MQKILVKIPTRNRPDKLERILHLYNYLTRHIDNVSFLISLDKNDVTLDAYMRVIELFNNLDITTVIGISKSKVDAVNRDINDYLQKRDDIKIIVIGSDDMIPIKRHWDEEVIKCANSVGLDYVYWFHDGAQKRLNTLSIMGIDYYKRFNYIYHPSYKSLWCDNEFHDVALSLNKMNKYPLDMIIRHEHPAWFKGAKSDSLYKHNDTFWNEDEANYKKRKQLNFPL